MDALPFGPSPIDSISGIWKFHRPGSRTAQAVSLPGHLIHYVISGAYTLLTNRREYKVKAGDILYYYESEEVLWKGGPQAVSFYSIGFMAKKLPPLPMDRRCLRANGRMKQLFMEIFQKSQCPESHQRTFNLYGRLMEILAFLYEPGQMMGMDSGTTGAWAEAERVIREKKLFRAGMDDLIRATGRSYSTLHRLTRSLFKQAPLQRIRDVRLDEARGLLKYSSLSVTEIADYLGYPGIAEFSREFTRCCGLPPRAFRKKSRILP